MRMFKSISGIYKITNKITGEFYIGSSTDCYRRFYQHINKLEKNTHINKRLQNSYNKYGKEFFTYEVVQEVIRPKGLKCTKTFQKDYLFPVEQEIINNYDFNMLFNATKDARGYTDHLFSVDVKEKCLSTRKSKKNIFYSYDYEGNKLNEYKLISDLDKNVKIRYIDIEKNVIYDKILYTYSELSIDDVKSIFIKFLSENFKSTYYNLYKYFNLDIKYNYKKVFNRYNEKKVIAFNRNGDKFEFKSITEASYEFSISGSTISDAIKFKKQSYNDTINITYLCKGLVWFDDLSKTFNDAIFIYNLYDKQVENNKYKLTKSIRCVNIDDIDDYIEFKSITDANMFFYNKRSVSNINNVLSNKSKYFKIKDNKWKAEYI